MGVILMEKKIKFLVTAAIWLAASIWLCGETVAEDMAFVALEQSELLQVKVHRLIFDPNSQQPVVFLADAFECRALPIWINSFAANAIHSEMHGIDHFRPLTHDLLEKIIQKGNLKIHRVVITHLKEGVYYATILMEKAGSLLEIDARPSDSIVMALKLKAPIFVSKSLFRERAVPLAEKEEREEKYGLTFQNLTPALAQAFSFDSTRGVLVSDVRKGSPAEKDGIERGDIFVEVGGQTIEDVMSMKDALEKNKSNVQAKIYRKADFMSITLNRN